MANKRTNTLYVAPTKVGVGLTSVSIGLVRALDRVGLRVHFLKPIEQPHETDQGPDRSIHFIRSTTNFDPPTPIDGPHARELISEGNLDDLLEEIVDLFQCVAQDADVVVVEGLVPTETQSYAGQVNAAIVNALDAQVILVDALGRDSLADLNNRIEITARSFGGPRNRAVLGAIVNKIDMPRESGIPVTPESTGNAAAGNGRAGQRDTACEILEQCDVFKEKSFKLLGCIPWRQELVSPRSLDMAKFLGARILNEGELSTRRVTQIAVCARNVPNMVAALRPGVLIVTPGDRDDIILASCMATMNGVPLAGLLLTSGIEPDKRVMSLGEQAFSLGLPLLLVETDTYHTATDIREFNPEVPLDDIDRVELVMDTVARQIDSRWIKDHIAVERELRLSPPAFRHLLAERARQANKRIILPEGDEPRTIKAAATCFERGIARCVLLGQPDEIHRVAEAQGVKLPPEIEIVEPDSIRYRYVDPMVELRKHKGMTAAKAEQYLEDNVVLATLMLAQDEVDGLVSGAVHTTANTIRPALQFIRTSPDAKLVSSVFFMALPEQVLVYGDCAVNPDPNAEELADIAIQSAESAAAFGITPRVAMISYSTGASGSGSDVEKVREATRIARELRPDLLIDGPLQYDAAAIADVARSKAPDSPVAGKATVFIFPDLNTGNTTYKAVQRSANVISIGPMLQGLRKPVNDLSRGALVDDIVYTIALTAIQARQAEEKQERLAQPA